MNYDSNSKSNSKSNKMICVPLVMTMMILSIVLGDEVEAGLPPPSRRDRFPSVEERVRIYMSNWYTPPCQDDEILYRIEGDQVQVDNTTFYLDITPDQAFWMNAVIIQDCARDDKKAQNNVLPTSSKISFRHNMRMYCADVVEMLTELAPHHVKTGDTPLLAQFGDMKTSHIYRYVQLPHFKKFRSAKASSFALDNVTVDGPSCYHQHERPKLHSMHSPSIASDSSEQQQEQEQQSIYQPIIWKLATHRHYKYLPAVYREDTPWKEKINKAVWRGQLTGALEGFDKNLSDEQNCQNMFRCKLVYENADSEWVDALLTTTRGRLPDVLNGVELVGKKVTIQDLMTYKGIIMLEGNDVASGLKWSLLSQSVVLMPPPKHTSWAMEEKLQPWVHYIPLEEDASDAAEKMEWITQHEAKAKKIAERATLWMEDLVFHPDARRDDRLIKEEILRRYQAHFRPVRSRSSKDKPSSSDSDDNKKSKSGKERRLRKTK